MIAQFYFVAMGVSGFKVWMDVEIWLKKKKKVGNSQLGEAWSTFLFFVKWSSKGMNFKKQNLSQINGEWG